jgi:predicted adenylyl cyclase CyaB
MPTNIEIKVALDNRATAEAIAVRLSDSGPETIRQEDTFFRCDGARLKLRVLGSERGELIRYERSDVADARCSRYLIARTTDPEALKEILGKTLGITGVVRKTRTLYLRGQTRMHIDEVERLGTFLELEVVMRDGQTEAEGKTTAENLMLEFGIDKQQLIPKAYIDLMH